MEKIGFPAKLKTNHFCIVLYIYAKKQDQTATKYKLATLNNKTIAQ